MDYRLKKEKIAEIARKLNEAFHVDVVNEEERRIYTMGTEYKYRPDEILMYKIKDIKLDNWGNIK